MAKQTLQTNFVDDILEESMSGKRRYNLIQNDDGTVSLEDVTNYSQIGSSFGAAQVNAMNNAINESADKSKIIDNLSDIAANQQSGMMAGALAVRELNNKIIDTGYATSQTLSLPLGQVCIVYTTVVGYYCVSLSGGITLLTMYKTEDGIAYVVDNNARTITFTAKEGGNVRFVVIKP